MTTDCSKNEELRQLENARQMYLHDYATKFQHAERKGLEKGRVEGCAKSILQILAIRFQVIPQPVEEQILAITDLGCLEKLTSFAVNCKSLDEFTTVVKGPNT